MNLFELLFSDLTEDEEIETRVKLPDGSWHALRFSSPEDVALEFPGGRVDAFFGVNPRKKGTQLFGRNEDVSRINVLVADIDRVSDVREAAAPYAIEPTAVVASGGGFHLYWLLDESTSNDDTTGQWRRAFTHLGTSDAVHDAARILRIPESDNSKYTPRRKVQIIDLSPTRTYPAWIFRKLPALRKLTRQRLYTGDSKDFESRSERDYSIVNELVVRGWTDDEIAYLMEISPAGERYREDWPQKLSHDTQTARAKQSPLPGDESGYFQVAGHSYYTVSTSGSRRVSTFVLRPTSLMEGIDTDDYIVCDILAEGSEHIWEGFPLPKRAFTDRRSLNRFLTVAAWQWLGTDNDVIQLLPFLMKYIQEKNVPIIRVTKSLGRHGDYWVTAESVLGEEGITTPAAAGVGYLGLGTPPIAVVSYLEGTEDKYNSEVTEMFKLLMRVNTPDVVLPMLAWMIASIWKEVLAPSGREFPVLQVYGNRGTGKTSLISNVMLPLLGYEQRSNYSCDTTDFVLMSLLGSSTSIPVFLAEYRSDIAGATRLLRRLRLLYDSGQDARGRPDQTVTTYPLTAPVVLDGEEYIDDSAMVERSVLVRLSREGLNIRSEEAYRELTALPLHHFAGRLHLWSLTHKPDVLGGIKLLEQTAPIVLPERIRRSAGILIAAYVTLEAYLEQRGMFHLIPEATPDTFKTMLSSWLGVDKSGDMTFRAPMNVDTFIEELVSEIAASGHAMRQRRNGTIGNLKPFVWLYDPNMNYLAFHMTTAAAWFQVSRRRRGLLPMSKLSLTTQIQGAEYFVEKDRRHTSAGTHQVFVIDLGLAVKYGLDIPDRLEMLTVKGGD